MSDLYPRFDMPDIVGATENTVVAFPKSWLWDWDICDFVQTGSGDVVEVDGLTAWVQWCVKAILTQRLAFVVYDWNYGADIESCLKQPTRAVTEAELEREITEALLTDPRTAEVKNFRFEWNGDELTVWFTVVNALGQPAEIQVGVGYREVQRQFSLSRVEQYVSDWLRGELVNVEPTEDGKLVIKTVAQPTFTRDSIAYKSDGSQVAVNVPRFEQGKFGQAVLVEEGTTNLNSDPFFKTGVSGWGVGTWTTLEWLSSEYNPFSKQNGVMRLYDNDGDKGHCLKGVSISNTPHTVSVLLKILKGNINNINVGGTIYYTDSTYTDYTWNDSNTTRYDMSAIFGQGVYKLVATITPNSSKTISKYEIRISHSNTVETELLVYAIQLEQKPYATSFINGTRYPETLTIPTASVLNPQEGTVEFWWMPINQPASTIVSQQTSPPIFEIGTYWQPNSLILWVYAGVGLRLLVRGNEATTWTGNWTIISGFNWYQLNCWYHIALRWQNGNTFYVFVNGVKYGPYVSSLPLTSIAGNIMSLGKLNASSGGSNALFDDLRISSRARTDEEIAAAYQSNQPLPVDAWTTLKLDFNGDLSTQSGVIP